MGIIAGIRARQERWEDIRARLIDIVADVMEQHPDEIVEYNREQMMDGIDSDGLMFKAYRDQEYADYKHVLNPRPGKGIADFRLTREFHSKMFLRITGRKFEMDSTDDKRDKLVQMAVSKTKIFGLTEENRHRVWREVLRDPVIERIANISTGKISF
jgi:hypothetical protein